MKKHFLIFSLSALTLFSCGGSQKQNQNLATEPVKTAEIKDTVKTVEQPIEKSTETQSALTFADLVGIYDNETDGDRICLLADGSATWGMLGSLNFTEYVYTISGNEICLKTSDDDSDGGRYQYDAQKRTLKDKDGKLYVCSDSEQSEPEKSDKSTSTSDRPEIFAESSWDKNELYTGHEDGTRFLGGDFNGDEIQDLVVAAENKCAVYFQDKDNVYTYHSYAQPADGDIDFSVWVDNGEIIIDASSESSKTYTMKYQDGAFYLILFQQDMEWPDGGGEYHETDDFIKKTRHVWTEKSDTIIDISSKPMLKMNEIHFGYVNEGPY